MVNDLLLLYTCKVKGSKKLNDFVSFNKPSVVRRH